MAALNACQDAIARLVARRPSSVFASDDEICVEIASLANEAAIDIVKAHDWQVLTVLHTINGDGVTADWPLPGGYDRMALGSGIHSGSWAWRRYENSASLDDWLGLQAQAPALPPGYWNILADRLHFLPIIPAGEVARFYYVTRNFARSSGGAPKALFDRDDDVFTLDDRLLTLALIWRWKSMKGMDYQEDIRNYDIALSQEMARDKGSRTIRGGHYGRRPNARAAWPWELG